MKCTQEKCPIKNVVGEVERCTVHNCPDRTLPNVGLGQKEKLVRLVFDAFRISEEKWDDVHVKDVVAHLIENGVAVPVRCGKCRHSINSKTPCAYRCGNRRSPCYGRVTYADFGCLYGESKEESV